MASPLTLVGVNAAAQGNKDKDKDKDKKDKGNQGNQGRSRGKRLPRRGASLRGEPGLLCGPGLP